MVKKAPLVPRWESVESDMMAECTIRSALLWRLMMSSCIFGWVQLPRMWAVLSRGEGRAVQMGQQPSVRMPACVL